MNDFQVATGKDVGALHHVLRLRDRDLLRLEHTKAQQAKRGRGECRPEKLLSHVMNLRFGLLS